MIVDPDFLDHWRTRMVVDALGGDEMAPTYILRLWSHCQLRKEDRFTMPPAGLKAQCRYQGDAEKFEQALSDAGFVKREGGVLHVTGWAEHNASLIAAWENGAKGGRPRKPRENPQVTDSTNLDGSEEPTGNPAVTQGEPNSNPDETDKRREEKRRTTSPNGEVSGAAQSAAPPTPPPDFDGRNAETLNGKAIVPIAVDWELPEQWGVDAEALGWKPQQVLRESEKFRQYWVAGKGKGTRRSVKGWRQSWSNWLEKAAKDHR